MASDESPSPRFSLTAWSVAAEEIDVRIATRRSAISTFCALALLLFAYTQLTIFVVAQMGGVSLLCRGAVLGGIGKSDALIARFPYSDFLYLASTGGKRYER